jgi:MOSC domain-containing protein YiiM
MKTFKILSINISDKKGEKKISIPEAVLKENYGIEGDAHAGDWHRQVSLLAWEDIEEMIRKGANVKCGDFAENITTEGIELAALPIGAMSKARPLPSSAEPRKARSVSCQASWRTLSPSTSM